MKKIPLMLIFLTLSACTQTQKDNDSINPEITKQTVTTLKKGETCGKQNQKKCDINLECRYNEEKQKSLCEEMEVNNLQKCPETQDPVCAKKNNNRNGYLNECEAKRHNAEILHKGFCKPNTTIKKQCFIPMETIGNCETLFSGFEFINGECKERKILGCDADIPFETKEVCEKTCFENGIPKKQSTVPEINITVNKDGVVSSKIPSIQIIPETCTQYFDGCNTCTKTESGEFACTLMICEKPEKPYCIK